MCARARAAVGQFNLPRAGEKERESIVECNVATDRQTDTVHRINKADTLTTTEPHSRRSSGAN